MFNYFFYPCFSLKLILTTQTNQTILINFNFNEKIIDPFQKI